MTDSRIDITESDRRAFSLAQLARATFAQSLRYLAVGAKVLGRSREEYLERVTKVAEAVFDATEEPTEAERKACAEVEAKSVVMRAEHDAELETLEDSWELN